jgi:hypothetical protein
MIEAQSGEDLQKLPQLKEFGLRGIELPLEFWVEVCFVFNFKNWEFKIRALGFNRALLRSLLARTLLLSRQCFSLMLRF